MKVRTDRVPVRSPGPAVWILSLSLLAWVAGCGPRVTHLPPPPESSLRGRVTLSSVDAREVIVYVTPAPGTAALPDPGDRPTLVTLSHHDFSPRVLPVREGGVVEFRNTDSLYHNVFSISPAKRFDVGRFAPGEQRSVTFERRGVVRLFCALDSHMAGWVLVLPNARTARPDAAGAFSFEGLRKGRYVVHVWDPVHAEKTRLVDLTGPRATVTIAL